MQQMKFERIALERRENPAVAHAPTKESESEEMRLRRKYHKERKKRKVAECCASGLEKQLALHARHNHQVEQENEQMRRKLDDAQRALDAALRDEDGFIVLKGMVTKNG